MDQKAEKGQRRGKVIVCYTDRVISDECFYLSKGDPKTYLTNVIQWFTGGQGGKFAALSTFVDTEGLDEDVRNTIERHGGTLDVLDAAPDDLSPYDVLILIERAVDSTALLNFVKAGGCVYIAAGCDWLAPPTWNPFLSHFGITLADSVDFGERGVFKITKPISHPVLEGVDAIFVTSTSKITLSDDKPPSTQAIAYDSHNPPRLALVVAEAS